MYKDAGSEDGFELRQTAMENGVGVRLEVSQRLIDLFIYPCILQ